MGYPMEKKFWKDTNEDSALYTTRKLINTMEIPREYFHWYIVDGFYRRKYSLGIYRGNYSGKKN
jgi:hypothetical protein